ncbi:hypothetical protein NPIL_498951, partial [Nephila pilipes]
VEVERKMVIKIDGEVPIEIGNNKMEKRYRVEVERKMVIKIDGKVPIEMGNNKMRKRYRSVLFSFPRHKHA